MVVVALVAGSLQTVRQSMPVSTDQFYYILSVCFKCSLPFDYLLALLHSFPVSNMLPPMKSKSMKAGAKAMSKGAMTKALATKHGLKQKACSEIINSLVTIATSEVKKTGIFTVHGLCRIKTRVKPATKAGVRMMFGAEHKVKAKAAKTVVKAYPVAALKKQI